MLISNYVRHFTAEAFSTLNFLYDEYLYRDAYHIYVKLENHFYGRSLRIKLIAFQNLCTHTLTQHKLIENSIVECSM